jgi:hypothetical protein
MNHALTASIYSIQNGILSQIESIKTSNNVSIVHFIFWTDIYDCLYATYLKSSSNDISSTLNTLSKGQFCVSTLKVKIRGG